MEMLEGGAVYCALGLSHQGRSEARYLALSPGRLWQPGLHLQEQKLPETPARGSVAHVCGKELGIKGYRIRELS